MPIAYRIIVISGNRVKPRLETRLQYFGYKIRHIESGFGSLIFLLDVKECLFPSIRHAYITMRSFRVKPLKNHANFYLRCLTGQTTAFPRIRQELVEKFGG